VKDESKEIIKASVKSILQEIEGTHNLRHDLVDTPQRVANMIDEILGGYNVNIEKIFKSFDGEGKGQIVIVRNIEFISFCEHHCLPFTGSAYVAYLPNGKVIGVSKIPRLVFAYARRLQLQERIASQVANAIMQHLQPHGVAVIIRGEHSCMRCRGAKASTSDMVNSVMLGKFLEDAALRAEVLSLIGKI
jgi:GTP cyclohydrolase I